MASNSRDASDKSAACPLYYRGIPKDLGKKRSPPMQPKVKLDAFGQNFLANFEQRRKQAREKRLAEEEARRKVEEQEKARKEEERKNASNAMTRKILGMDRPNGSRRSGISSSSRRGSASGSVRGGITKRKTNRASRVKRSSRKDDDDDDFDEDRYMPMQGMEVVERKKRIKAPEVRNTSDYSDLFGDKYLLGADVELTRGLAKSSKEETARFRAAEREKQAERDFLKQQGAKYDAAKLRMERTGELKSKKGREKLRLLREELFASTYKTVGQPSSSLAGASTKPKTKKAVAELKKTEIASKKASLMSRISAMAQGPEYQKYESRRPAERRVKPKDSPPLRSLKRSRVRNVTDSDEEEYDLPPRRPRKTVKRRPSYISDSDDGGDSDSDGSGGGMFQTTFDEVEEEEAYSAKIAKMEDRREFRALQKAKAEKQRRRKAAGLDSDSDD